MKTDLSRRSILKFAAAGSVATLPAVALAAPEGVPSDPAQLSDEAFNALFLEWERRYNMDYAGLDEEETERGLKAYVELCDRITMLTATTEKQFAMQYVVAIDRGDSDPSRLFDRKMFAILDIARPRHG